MNELTHEDGENSNITHKYESIVVRGLYQSMNETNNKMSNENNNQNNINVSMPYQ